MTKALGPEGDGLITCGSPGTGNWAEVPWLAVFDSLVTDTATRGYYVVYLFHASQRVVYLSLNQGTTIVRQEFANAARQVLADRAEFMRKRLTDLVSLLPTTFIDLGSNARLPGDYAAGHALGIRYELADLPDSDQLGRDLRNAVRAYRALTFRGGLDTDVETMGESPLENLVEIRRYRLHARIERNPRAVREAKNHHGTRCQACEMSFADVYGEIGEGFIEAHHLRPIASLEEGVPVHYNVSSDFAVLCANCHRMIHKMENPSDIAALRQALTR
jgi:5-methylcytosine-specific restriction protein A